MEWIKDTYWFIKESHKIRKPWTWKDIKYHPIAYWKFMKYYNL